MPERRRTALITGGAKRIGAEIARTLAENDINVIIHYRGSHREAERLAEQLSANSVAVDIVGADLLDTESVEEMIRTVKSLTGHLDILINNASIFHKENLLDLNPDNLWANIQIHALQPFLLTKTFFDKNSGSENGVVINLLDTRINGYDHEHVPYHLSKRMLRDLTIMLAFELAPRVRVNGIAPGPILPPINGEPHRVRAVIEKTPLRKFGDPRNIADTVLFLINNDFITGQVIHVDGGFGLEDNFYA
jgi:pteridine reductase